MPENARAERLDAAHPSLWWFPQNLRPLGWGR